MKQFNFFPCSSKHALQASTQNIGVFYFSSENFFKWKTFFQMKSFSVFLFTLRTTLVHVVSSSIPSVQTGGPWLFELLISQRISVASLAFLNRKWLQHSEPINSTVPCEVLIPLLTNAIVSRIWGMWGELEAHSDLWPWQLCCSPGSWVMLIAVFALGSVSWTGLLPLISQLQRRDVLRFFA